MCKVLFLTATFLTAIFQWHMNQCQLIQTVHQFGKNLRQCLLTAIQFYAFTNQVSLCMILCTGFSRIILKWIMDAYVLVMKRLEMALREGQMLGFYFHIYQCRYFHWIYCCMYPSWKNVVMSVNRILCFIVYKIFESCTLITTLKMPWWYWVNIFWFLYERKYSCVHLMIFVSLKFLNSYLTLI